MPFPEFEPGTRRVLFFSRGRGRGHAVPDIEVIRALQATRSDVQVRVVSYGTGAATFAGFGFPVVDFGLPENGAIAEMSVLAGKLIGWLNPELVVAHEEFAVMPAAKIFDKRTVFLLDWFNAAETYAMGSLKFADEILFLGGNGRFAEPAWVQGKVRYVGPVLRQFQYGPADRHLARRDLGIPQQAFVLTVLPGSWREADTPALELVVRAFDSLEQSSKALIWVAGKDGAAVEARLAGRQRLVFEQYWDVDRLMVAADVAITKMNRKTVLELHHLGVPAIALTWNLNPMDDRTVEGVEGVVCLPAGEISAGDLAAAIRDQAAQPRLQERRGDAGGAKACAERIGAALSRERR